MDATLLIAAAGLVLGAAVLTRGVERVMHRLGVRPANPGERSGGISDVLERLAAWHREKSSSRDK